MIYLASQFTCTKYLDDAANARIEQSRYEAALKATAFGIRKGHTVYSPIVHGYHVERVFRIGGNWHTWARHSTDMLRRASVLGILTLHDWEESEGITAELELAQTLNIPVRHYDTFFDEVL